MKFVIDQNYLRSPELKKFLTASKANVAVITDMAIFEMLKGSNPAYTAEKSLAILSRFPGQVLCTSGTGELMRQELNQKKPIKTPVDKDLTARMRKMLTEVSRYLDGARPDFPLDEAHVTKSRASILSQRLDHSFHKKTLSSSVGVLRKEVEPDLQKQFRRGKLTKEVYAFLYQTGFLAFKNGVVGFPLTRDEIADLYVKYSLTARSAMVYTLSYMHWFASGGTEALPEEHATNDLHDLDYIVLSSYFDGILSKEKRVNKLYVATKEFFEFLSAT